MNINLIHFDTSVGVKKPRTMLKSSIDSCPFCDVEHLTDIIEIEDDMIFLKNKYVVVEGSDQFVIIEGSECHSDMPRYSKDKMHRLIRFGLKHWKNLLNSGKYEDVLFFKNYGELSGGTIRHPHMQLVGFPKLNRDLLFDPIELHGEIIFESDGVEINISTTPRSILFRPQEISSIQNRSIHLQISFKSESIISPNIFERIYRVITFFSIIARIPRGSIKSIQN